MLQLMMSLPPLPTPPHTHTYGGREPRVSHTLQLNALLVLQ